MPNIKVTSRMTIKQTSAGGSPPVDTVEMGGQGEEEKMPDVNEKKTEHTEFEEEASGLGDDPLSEERRGNEADAVEGASEEAPTVEQGVGGGGDERETEGGVGDKVDFSSIQSAPVLSHFVFCTNQIQEM